MSWLDEYEAPLATQEPKAKSKSWLDEYEQAPASRPAPTQAPAAQGEKPGFFGALAGHALEGLSTIPDAFSLAGDQLASPGVQEVLSGRNPREEAQYQATNNVPGHPAPQMQFHGPMEALAGGLKGAAQKVYPEAGRGTGGFPEKVGGLVGDVASLAPAMAAGGPMEAVALGAQMGVPAYYKVLEKTGDKAKATGALLFGGALGQLGMFGVAKPAASLIKKFATGMVGQELRNVATKTALGALAGGAVAGAQTGLGDLMEEHLTGEDLDNWKRIKEAVPPALLVGTVFSGLDAVVGERMQAKARAKSSETPKSSEPTAAPKAEEIQPLAVPAPGIERKLPEVTPPPTEAKPPEIPESSAPPATAAPEPQKTTGIKNRTVERELADMGMPPPPKNERAKDTELHAQAKEIIEKDAHAGAKLVKEILAKPRNISDQEGAVLTFEANRLINERDAAEAEFNKNPTPENQARIEQVRSDYAQAADAMKKAGTEWSASGRARQMMLARDYSLAAMERSMQVAKGGEKLTPDELVKVKDLHNKMEAARVAHEAHVSKVELARAEAEAKAAKLELENMALRDSKKLESKATRAKKQAGIAATRKRIDEIIDKLAGGTKAAMNLDPEKIKLVGQLAAEHIRLGYQHFDVWADEMAQRIGEHVRPYLRTAWDQAQKEKDEQMLKTYKSRKASDIETLKYRGEKKLFGKKRRETPVAQDKEAIRLKADYEQARRQFERQKAQHERANRTTVEKARDIASEALDLPRAIFSSFDASAVRRQGGFFTSAHPFRSVRHAGEMFKTFANPRAALEADVAIRSRPNYELGEAAGLELTSADGLGPGEEAIRSTLSDKIPGVKGSNRAYVTYLNLQRAQAFDMIIDSLPHKPPLKEAQAIADFVNVATGRASGSGKAFAQKLEAIKLFWAPKYVVSRFQLLGKPITAMLDKRLSFAAKRAIGKEFAKYAAGQMAYYGLLAGAASAVAKSRGETTDIETDLRSSDFGKVRIGDVRLDPLAGLSQTATFLARMVTGKTKTLSGEVKDLSAPKSRVDQNRLDVALRFGRSKLGPLQGRVADALSGETFTGKKVTPSQALLAPPLPGAVDDTVQAMRRLGVPAGAILGIFAMLGDNVQTYTDTKKTK